MDFRMRILLISSCHYRLIMKEEFKKWPGEDELQLNLAILEKMPKIFLNLQIY